MCAVGCVPEFLTPPSSARSVQDPVLSPNLRRAGVLRALLGIAGRPKRLPSSFRNEPRLALPLAASPPFAAFFFFKPLTRLFPHNHRNQKKTALPRVPHLRRLRHRHLHLHSVERLERRGPLLPRLRQLRRVATGRLPPLRRRGPRCADGAEGARREELRPLRQAVNWSVFALCFSLALSR